MTPFFAMLATKVLMAVPRGFVGSSSIGSYMAVSDKCSRPSLMYLSASSTPMPLHF